MVRSSRKGQWFLIGGLILVFLLSYIATIRSQVGIDDSVLLEQDFTFKNILGATRSALSDTVLEGTEKSYVEGRLLGWKYVLENFAAERASNISAFIFLGIPHQGYINVTALNFVGHTLGNTTISAGAASMSGIELSNGAINTFYLPESAEYFNVSISYTLDSGYGPEQETISFETTRKSFYAFKILLSKRSGSQLMQATEYG